MAWSQSDVEIRHQQFSVAQVHAFQHLANFIIYNVPEFRAPPEILKRNTLSQTGLWRFGISGDEPIVLVSLNDPSQAKLAYELLLSHEYLRLRGIKFDLVLLNEYPGGYMQNFQEELEFMIKSSYSRHFYEKRAGVFLRTRGQLSDEEIRLLFSAARVVLNGEKGSIAQQLKIEIKDEGAPSKPGAGSPFSVVASDDGSGFRGPEPKWDFANGFGGFTQDGKAYAMRTRYDQLPPLPWANVVANRDFGFLITESGAGYTWSDNSRENRLTNWSNDPISDPFSEVIYIRDSESGDYWCPTVRPVNHGELVIAEHAFGHSDFVTRVNSIHSHLSISAATQDRVKWWNLELTNSSKDGRELELYLYIEWVLGVSREETYRYIISSYDNDGSFLYATNPFNIDFSNHVTFVGCSHSISSYTANRKEFLGRLGEHGNPRLLEDARPGEGLGQLLSGGKRRGVKLSKTTGAGFDPCAVLKVDLTLGAGEKRNILFYMGQAGNIFDARTAASRYRSMSFYAAERKAQKELWDGTLGALQVQSPDRSFDFLANGWLLYQTLSCRMFARTGFFQSSGALGFRDQLQDSMAMLLVKPELTKRQILLNATRQFLEGDVQHWWHPPSGKGVRTKISDNYLWLPFAVLEYLRVTGDRSILEESATFLEGPLLDQHQMEVYITPQVSNKSATIYEHCLIALDRSMVVGERGLPLIGAGDWNDGMNAVGEGGKGESVWLAWFLADISARSIPWCNRGV
ncbi:MAG: hypothetical protein DCC75_11955 [Proteobacteria bacterium]|nr:MAG: hypothetical protein DCC75_11955 [Pseudomonadota bacterium]